MDEPRTKKRRLAPKVDSLQSLQQQQQNNPQARPFSSPLSAQQPSSPTALRDGHLLQHRPLTSDDADGHTNDHADVPGRPVPPQQHTHDPRRSEAARRDFFAFAQTLQNAAMYFKQRGEHAPHSAVSVLLLQWAGGPECPADGRDELETVVSGRLAWATERWDIPADPDRGGSWCEAQLADRLSAMFERCEPTELVVVYYAGHSVVDSDGETYWASRADGSPRIRWTHVRQIIEQAIPEVLLVMDCSLPAPLTTTTTTTSSGGSGSGSGSGSMKQVLAAGSPNAAGSQPPSRPFASILAEALAKLADTGVAFTSKRLHAETSKLALASVRAAAQTGRVDTSDASSLASAPSAAPALATLVSGKFSNLCLGPVTAGREPRPSRPSEIDPRAVADLRFDEERVLVCTTFLGAADDQMLSSVTDRLPGSRGSPNPTLMSCVALEAMFLGPPTTLLISMPQYVYDLVQGNKICLFLGQISSRNLLGLYDQLSAAGGGGLGLSAAGAPSAAGSAGCGVVAGHVVPVQASSKSVSSALTPPRSTTNTATPTLDTDHATHDGESAELEAAEQLKALKNPRQHHDDNEDEDVDMDGGDVNGDVGVMDRPASSSTSRNILPGLLPTPSRRPVPLAPLTTTAGHGLLAAQCVQPAAFSSPPRLAPAAPRRSSHPLPQRRPSSVRSLECDHCGDHGPFKDAVSLRKHVAAAHTRPFPCSFSMAGCRSTFGSKNEWKRHMSTQHIASHHYVCVECPPRAGSKPADSREFNRLDLLRSHIRRLHTPPAVKHSRPDSRERAVWEGQIRALVQRCLVTRRLPPQKCACPRKECVAAGGVVFSGLGAWDEWTEHVGKHLERGECDADGARVVLGLDPLLVQWAVREGILDAAGPGGWVSLADGGGGADPSSPSSSSAASLSAKGGPARRGIRQTAGGGAVGRARVVIDDSGGINDASQPVNQKENANPSNDTGGAGGLALGKPMQQRPLQQSQAADYDVVDAAAESCVAVDVVMETPAGGGGVVVDGDVE